MSRKTAIHKNEEEILSQVPPDYYQKGIKNNFLQKSWHTGKLKTVLNLIEDDPKKVLDVGCASGWFLNEIHKIYPSAECYGVDKYKKAVVYGNKKYKNIIIKYSDAHRLPFKENTFDLVICTEVLEHVENPALVLDEIKRVLRPNGYAVVEMDSGNFIFKAVWYWWTNIRKGVWRDAHIHVFNTNKLENLIKKSKFKLRKRKIFNFTMGVAFLLQK